jgi:purine-binding chemotaxis protein CheW
VYRRLAAVRLALAQEGGLTPAAQRHLLRARARALALAPAGEAAAQAGLDVVMFRLADALYGVEAAYVREVLPLKNLTPLPCTPSFVIGLINAHGQILSVLDLQYIFDLPVRGLTDRNQVIVVHHEHMAFGLLSDAILGVRSMPRESLQPGLPTLPGRQVAYLKAVTREQLVIVDAGKLLADPKLLVLEAVEGDHP